MEEVPVLEDSDVVASVDLQEGDTIETGVNVASGELNNWSRVSPSKVGRSPGRSVQQSQADEFQISGSKFSVLGVDDEEEGEIMEEAPQTIFVGSLEIIINTDEGSGEVRDTTGQLEASGKESQSKGVKQSTARERKAKPQDTNPSAMNTRSSRRHH